ncbi:MAG: magnesium/cobalt transporter CorA, partial [Planctomycetia bacterium]
KVDELRPLRDRDDLVLWLNVEGLGDVETIMALGTMFNLHPLALEDVLNVQQRPKVDDYGDQLFIVLRMALKIAAAEPAGVKRACLEIQMEQLSIFMGKRFLLTFQLEDRPGDALDPVRDRLRRGIGRIRAAGSDYLTYAVVDAVVDAYFPLIEEYGNVLDQLEDDVLLDPGPATIQTLHRVKRDLLSLRRALWPMRDAVGSLLRDEKDLFTPETLLHFRDAYDHLLRLLDFLETDRELCADLLDLYLSSISQRMNEIMKVLTVIATIFIPLTFISSVYGMNFSTVQSPWNMPELNWYFGYPACLALMTATGLGMIGYFWRIGWLAPMPKPHQHAQGPDETGPSWAPGAASLKPPTPHGERKPFEPMRSD